MDKPTYLRAAIEDWMAVRISLERLCEIWHVPEQYLPEGPIQH